MKAGGSDDRDRAFWVEGFQDYLGFEAGTSPNTVEAYTRDLRRLAEYAVSRGVQTPGSLTPKLLREFVYHLKDLGLAPASIRRQISTVPRAKRQDYRCCHTRGAATAPARY